MSSSDKAKIVFYTVCGLLLGFAVLGFVMAGQMEDDALQQLVRAFCVMVGAGSGYVMFQVWINEH